MGRSVDAHLIFGISLGDSAPKFMYDENKDEEIDFDDVLTKDAGIGTWGEAYDRGEHDEFYVKRKEVLKTASVDFRFVGHCDFPEYILYVKGYDLWSWDHGEIAAKDLEVPEEKIATFKEWCKVHGLGYVEPKWLLRGSYG